MLLVLLASKYGLRARLRELRPRLDRLVNAVLIAVVIVYTGQLLWLWLSRP